MAELGSRRQISEPISPNTDAVRDAVNPLRGLADVSVGLEKASSVLAEMKKDSELSEAYVKFSDFSASAHTSYYDNLHKIATKDAVSEISSKSKSYTDRVLKPAFEKFLGGIADQQVRQHFRAVGTQMFMGFDKTNRFRA